MALILFLVACACIAIVLFGFAHFVAAPRRPKAGPWQIAPSDQKIYITNGVRNALIWPLGPSESRSRDEALLDAEVECDTLNRHRRLTR